MVLGPSHLPLSTSEPYDSGGSRNKASVKTKLHESRGRKSMSPGARG